MEEHHATSKNKSSELSKDIQRLTSQSSFISSEVEKLFDSTQLTQTEPSYASPREIECSLREENFQLTQNSNQVKKQNTNEEQTVNNSISMSLALDDLDDLIGDDMKEFL